MATAYPTIFPVSELDFESVADIYNEYILLGNVTMEESLYDYDRVKKWVEGFDESEKILVLKNAQGRVIGWGVVKKYSEREGYKTACETSVYLTQQECGKGYGTMLKKHLIEECKKVGYHHIVAKIFASNTSSIEYNLKLGYEMVGRQKEIGYKNGHWQDVVILQYLIK